MKEIVIKTSAAEYTVHCGGGTFSKYASQIISGQFFVISDRDVFAYYRYLLWDVLGEGFPVYIMPSGETGKSFANLKCILTEMLKAGMRRDCTVVSFGGGVVGDMAGLAAALYMRGVRFVQIPTTLLAQADSCIGGKTAVDFGGIKNLVGTFYPPAEVIADPRFFSTLSDRDIRCGLGEIIKCATIDEDLFGVLENCKDLSGFDFFEDMVFRCLSLKASIVQQDEFDLKGIRKVLNSGHTTAHAFEGYYRKKSHGEYVLAGLYYEAYIALKLGVCDEEYFGRLKNLIFRVMKAPFFPEVEKAAEAALSDKKNRDANICVIAPVSLGKCGEIRIPLQVYSRLLKECSDELKGEHGAC